MEILSILTSEIKKYYPILKHGQKVLLNGTVFTARDAAHKRFFELIDNEKPLPFDIDGAVIYYAGPTPAPEGFAVGSCGPTTSSRMDVYAPKLLDLGLAGMVGKGPRNKAVLDALSRNNALYFCAIGGAGALYSKCITSCEVVAFDDLGCESVKKITVKDFPVIVSKN